MPEKMDKLENRVNYTLNPDYARESSYKTNPVHIDIVNIQKF